MPSLYQLPYLKANGCVADMMGWVDQWLQDDDSLHVYWMVPPKRQVSWRDVDLCANHDRVTVIDVPIYDPETKVERASWNGNVKPTHLERIQEEIIDAGAYVDIVVNQHPKQQDLLFEVLNYLTDEKYSATRPFDLVYHSSDFGYPYKQFTAINRNDFRTLVDTMAFMIADGGWFKAKIDYDDVPELTDWIQYDVATEIQEQSIVAGSPFDFDAFDTTFSDTPEYVHLAGSVSQKKRRDDIMAVAEFLYQRFDIETIITCMRDIEQDFVEKEYTDCYANSDYDTYVEQAERADLCIELSKYETMGRTWLEQAASGQVFLAPNERWIEYQLPEDYRLRAGSTTQAKKLAAWAVTHWEEAVAETERLLDHVKSIRGREPSGAHTLADLHERLRAQQADHRVQQQELVADALTYVDEPFTLADLNAAGTRVTESESPLTGLFHYPRIDLVRDLRALGYEDQGGVEPSFVQTDRWT